MESQRTPVEEAVSELVTGNDETTRVHQWRTEQLRRLGYPGGLASSLADMVDWHDIARLIERGCAPTLALKIVR